MSQNGSHVTDDAADAGEFAQTTLNSIGDAIIGTHPAGHVPYLSRVSERLIGWPREAALVQPLDEVFRIVAGTHRAAALNRVALAIRQNRTVSPTGNGALIRRDRFESAIEDSVAPIHDREGHLTGAVMVLRDVSQTRATLPEASHCAQHDYLTDWPKRPPHNGRSDKQFFEWDSNVRSLERQFLKHTLHRALERREFVLRYQPKMNLQTGAMTGAEALVRWRHPQCGLVLAAQFIPLAQEYGCIVPAETREQLACLQASGCTEGQGYDFGLPVVAGELARWLKAA